MLIGPPGARARPHPWWTPVRIVLAFAVVTFALTAVAKAPCARGGSDAAWWNTPRDFANLCASDLPDAYTSGGLAEGVLPLSDSGGRFEPRGQTAPIAVVAYATAQVTRVLSGSPDTSLREGQSTEVLAESAPVRGEAVTYVGLSALVQLLAFLIAIRCLMSAVPGRNPRWALPLAAAPVIILAGLIAWDFIGVALACATVWAWLRTRPVAAGVLGGLATATAVWPLAILVAILAVAGRAGRTADAVRAVGSAVVTWVAINLVAFVSTSGSSNEYAVDYLTRSTGEGTLWRLFAGLGLPVSPPVASIIMFSVLALAALGLFAHGTRVSWGEQSRAIGAVVFVALVVVAVVGKTYEPAQTLWMLPFVVLGMAGRTNAARDLLIWQGFEGFAIVAFWWHAGGYTLSISGDDPIYFASILLRLAAEIWMAWRVLSLGAARACPVNCWCRVG